MGCSCSTQISNATTAITDEVALTTAAVEQCCADILEFYAMTAENIGQGLEACCMAWAEAGAGTVTIPSTETQVACPDGSTVTCGTPESSITTDSWAGTYMYGTAAQANAVQYQADKYAEQYSAWLAAYQQWQDAQIVPQMVALVAQIVAITKMYDEWTKYLGYTNTILQGQAEQAFPAVLDDFLANVDGNFSAHANTLAGTFGGIEGDIVDRVSFQCDTADKLADMYCNDGGGQPGYAVMEAQHTQDRAQEMANISGAAGWAIQDLKNHMMDLKAASEGTYDAFRDDQFAGITGTIADLYTKATEVCDYLNACGQDLVDQYTGADAPAANAFYVDQVADAQACLAQIQAAIADADAQLTQQNTLYGEYIASEAVLSPEIMAQAQALLNSGDVALDCFQFSKDCAAEFKQRYEDTWQVDEEALAKKILEAACALAAGLEEQYEFKTGLAEECLEHWQEYKDCDAELGVAIMTEAKALYDTRTDTFDQFVAQEAAWFECWQDHYKQLEHNYSAAIIDAATEQVNELNTELEILCDKAEEFCDWYLATLRSAEEITAPKVIEAGVPACLQLEDTYTCLDRMFDDLKDKWFDEVCDCDVDDILALCTLHDKRDVVCEIDEDAQCAKDIAMAAKDCYLSFGLTCEKDYLRELCNLEKYQPNFCDLENRAVRHVTKRFDIARENLQRQSSRFCVGDIEEQLRTLDIEQAKAEAAAMQAANNFERWWETKEDDRRHRYKITMLEQINVLAGLGYQGFAQSTDTYDRLLVQLNARLTRSYNWLAQGNQAASTSANSTAAAVSQSLQAIDSSHFWPRHHLDMKSEYNNQSAAMLLRAQEQTRIGHDYMSAATNANAQAEVTARGAIQDGLNAMTHGRQFKQLALQGSQAASVDAEQMQRIGLQHIDRGHFWINQARDYNQMGWGIASEAMRIAQQSVSQGHETLNQALAWEQHRDAMIRACRQNGMDAAAMQLEVGQFGHRKVQDALRMSENGLQAALRMLSLGQQQDSNWMTGFYNISALGPQATNAFSGQVRNGHNLMQMGITAGQYGYQNKMAMCEKLCEVLQQVDAQKVNQVIGFGNAASQSAQLSQMFGGGLANAVEGLLGSVQSLAGQPPSILNGGPQPGGTTPAGSGWTTIGGAGSATFLGSGA